MSDRGIVVWFTGLPAAGKTTLASCLVDELRRRAVLVDHLDGDEVRESLSRDLGFTDYDRALHVERVAWVAARLAGLGAVVAVSLVSPHEAARTAARRTVEDTARFVEVYVATPLDECIRRDPKGLYRKALSGEIPDFTGVSADYEPPLSPDLRLTTIAESPERSAARILGRLERSDPAFLSPRLAGAL